MAAVDLIVIMILGIAAIRGLLRGMIREIFSVLALASACLAVRFYAAPLAERIIVLADGRIGSLAAWGLAAVSVVIGVVAVIALAGSFLRRGAKSVGLGWADRLGGSVIGLAEGSLVAAVLLLLAVRILGSDTPTLRDSRSVAALDQLTRAVVAQRAGEATADVATPPPRDRAL
ncbi:MAG: CvpA family protein [Deltaproteobacteria bacterium]|nr:MAG: CvpA family protein [Deltaproteobacteria bacterium]